MTNNVNQSIQHETEIAIIGPGPTGLIAALAIAQETNHKPIIFGRKPSDEDVNKDTRTTAFMLPSITMLENLDLWHDLKPTSAPLINLRMIDDCGSLIRAPDCFFSARELGLEAFAHNITNKHLNQLLLKRVRENPNIRWVETKEVSSVKAEQDVVRICTAEGDRWITKLAIGADGRESLSRKASSIEAKKWAYDQTAIACSFQHELPHNSTSIEFHTPSGPLTLIPLKEYSASLVWSLPPEKAKAFKDLSEAAFCEILAEQTHAVWGKITAVAKRVTFPITGMQLNKVAANRIALIGEAAHVVPPIGAQGLNLGLRDIAHLVETIKTTPFEQNSTNLEQTYNQLRMSDINSRTTMIDLLNKSLLISFFPLKIARTAGLNALNASEYLRKQLMQQGLGSASDLPPLMQSREKLPTTNA